MTNLQFLSQASWLMKTFFSTMILRGFSSLFSLFCLRVMSPSFPQHLENNLCFPWPLISGLFHFSENSFSFYITILPFLFIFSWSKSVSKMLLPHLPLSPWSYVTSFTYFCTSDFARYRFENWKLFVLLGFFLQSNSHMCWSLPTLEHWGLLSPVLSVHNSWVNRICESFH